MNITPDFIKEFWLHQPRFLKNNLATERPNPITVNLSKQCNDDLASAFTTFLQVEINALDQIKQYISKITILNTQIQQCLSSNDGRIIIIGCGASGRAAVITKRICEATNPQLRNRIISVCSAGDVSLIRSVESFEDQEQFGINQLTPIITANDLVIGLSASGESPFILGGLKIAQKICKQRPWLIFNNTFESLIKKNPSHILTDKNTKINYLDLCVGEMALTGSTRLQATTAMQVVLGIAILVKTPNEAEIIHNINSIIDSVTTLNLAKLQNITALESKLVSNPEKLILYKTKNPMLALSMLADITERAPTFNISPLENWLKAIANTDIKATSNNLNDIQNTDLISKFYLYLENTLDSEEAWNMLLDHKPQVLNWADFPQTTLSYILGFDLSTKNPRNQLQNGDTLLYNRKEFSQVIADWQIISNSKNIPELVINLENESCNFELSPNLLINSLLIKIILNSHSTLMFGRLGYFEDNLMLSLSPTNFKLVDRAIRYTIFSLKHKFNQEIEYKIVANYLFKELRQLSTNESIVTKTTKSILKDIHPKI